MDTWDSAVADELELLLMEVMNGWCSKSVVDIVSDWIVGSSSNDESRCCWSKFEVFA